MPQVVIKVFVDVPRKVAREDWRAVVMEQLTEQIPESVYYTDGNDEEHEISCEVLEW